MQRKFKRSVRNLVVERIDSICMEVVSNNQKYIRLNRRSKRLQNEVMECLPDEVKKQFLLYEESEAWLNGILQKAIYRNGPLDGIRLANLSRKLLKL